MSNFIEDLGSDRFAMGGEYDDLENDIMNQYGDNDSKRKSTGNVQNKENSQNNKAGMGYNG